MCLLSGVEPFSLCRPQATRLKSGFRPLFLVFLFPLCPPPTPPTDSGLGDPYPQASYLRRSKRLLCWCPFPFVVVLLQICSGLPQHEGRGSREGAAPSPLPHVESPSISAVSRCDSSLAAGRARSRDTTCITDHRCAVGDEDRQAEGRPSRPNDGGKRER